MPSISDLQIFARVARTGNMSAAGREMGLTPAVVSKRISHLEEGLGARLFQRTTRQLMLTETGVGYFKRVVEILNLCDEAEDFISHRNTAPRGVLKVSVPTSFGRLHVAPHIADFLARYPEIRLDVHVADTPVDIVREGFDLAIRTGELADSSLVALRLAPDNLTMCAAPAYLEHRGAPASLADLEFHNCLSVSTSDVWRLVGPEDEQQFRPSGNVRCDSADFVRGLVTAGAGIGLLSTWEVAEAIADGRLLVVLPGYRGVQSRGIHVVYPSRDFMPAKAEAFIEFFSSLYGPEPYWEKDFIFNKMPHPRPAPAGRARTRQAATL